MTADSTTALPTLVRSVPTPRARRVIPAAMWAAWYPAATVTPIENGNQVMPWRENCTIDCPSGPNRIATTTAPTQSTRTTATNHAATTAYVRASDRTVRHTGDGGGRAASAAGTTGPAVAALIGSPRSGRPRPRAR